ncbi:MAG: prepilin-type N-terminal cleavage/methylation domain-containing protein [Planctomycetota bacterium]|nr:prepilin-type N-terminal cleavage/methylation domain-containing protein [Planctomycetota bacterium]
MARDLRSRGFTLLEMMVVMILLGIVAGLGFAGFDKMDPGSRGLQVSLETFLEATRDRARGSGQEVRVQILPADEEHGARIVRAVFQPAMEAGFEPQFSARERIALEGGARLGEPGRCGGGLSFEEGGRAKLEGRGGRVETTNGFTLEFDYMLPEAAAGKLFEWEGLLELEFRRGGGLGVRLRAGDGEFLAWVQLEAPPESMRLGRWQHLRFTAADGRARLWIDGEIAAVDTIGPALGVPTDTLAFGAEDSSFRGRVDEVLLWSRVLEEGAEVPEILKLELSSPEIVFDRHGRLDAASHADAVSVRLMDDVALVGGFMIGRFTQETLR